MSHRIFVALPISEKLQTEILAWEQNFQNLPVRWLKGKNMHVTLIPPWEEAEVSKVMEALRHKESKIGTVELNFDRVTFGPSPKGPRFVWTEGESTYQLSILRSQLYAILGFQPEPRPFRLHLTLARFRPEHFDSFPVKTLNERIEWHDTVDSFVLMESHLLPGGAQYEVLKTIPL